MLDIVLTNPYRVLGVYSNSPKRDRAANLTKIKNSLRVGDSVSFPSDMTSLLSELKRTNKMVTEANTKLVKPAKQFLYAQFWFVNVTPNDDIALNYLIEGDIDKAMQVWEKEDNASSLQNRFVCNLGLDNIPEAIAYAERLYASYKDDFVSTVIGNNFTIESEKIEREFLRELCSEMGAMKIFLLVSNPNWRRYISNDSLDSKERDEYAAKRYNMGVKLMNETIEKLNMSISQSNSQYQEIADKIGIEIMQCAIDYFDMNNLDNDAPKAMELLSYVMSVVVDNEARERCKKEVDRLQGIIDTLLPEVVREEARTIEIELKDFLNSQKNLSDSVALLNNTKPLLQSIKAKLGSTASTNPHYLKLSTDVVRVTIKYIVKEHDQIVERQNKIIEEEGMNYGSTIFEKSWEEINNINQVVVNLFLIMDSIDIEDSFKASYIENRSKFLKTKKETTENDLEGTPHTQEQPNPVYTTEKPNTKIHGWLKYFLVIFIIGGVLSALLPLVSMSDYENPWLLASDIVFGFVALAWTIYIVYLFTTRKPNAVFFTIAYIIMVIASRILALIDDSMADYSIYNIIYGFGWNLFMLFYMIFSEQVNVIIPKSFRKVTKRDWGILAAGILIPIILAVIGIFSPLSGYTDYTDVDYKTLEEYIHEQETIMKNTPLAYDERTDGRVIFKIPAGFTCESEDFDIDRTPLTMFYIEDEFSNSCTMCSDYDSDISVPNYNSYWENWKDDTDYTSYDGELTQVYINGNYCLYKITEYDVDGVYVYWKFYLLFNTETSKVFVASFYDTDYSTDYVMELLESVRFK